MTRELIEIKYRVLPEMREGVVRLRPLSRVDDLLKALGISPDSVVVTVDGEVVPEDYVLNESSDVVIYRVVSGG